jgi:choline dehydrogenase
VQPAPDPHPIAPAFLEGARALGFSIFGDQNGVLQESGGGGAISNVRIQCGRRLNTSASYLYPVMDRPNLTVLTGAHVNRVIIRDGKAIGVEFE